MLKQIQRKVKQFYLLFIVLFSINCFSQKYSFDISSVYNNDYLNCNQMIFTNSSNKNIKVILNQKKDFYIGAIREYKNDSLIYHFIEVRIDSINNFHYKYTSSMKVKLKKEKKCFDENNFYEVSTKKTNDDFEKIIIFRYKTAKKNKLISSVTLEVKDIGFDFLNHFVDGYLSSNFIDCQLIKYDKNILIKKASFSGETNYNLTLIDQNNIPIEVNIQKPIYNN